MKEQIAIFKKRKILREKIKLNNFLKSKIKGGNKMG